MDAVEFIKESRRMYKVTGKHSPTLAEHIPAEYIVKGVYDWASDIPTKHGRTCFWSSGHRRVLEVLVCCKYAPA